MQLRTILVLCILPAFALGAGKLILNKKYKLASSENFEEFMKAIGVGFFTRKIGNAVSPVIELIKDNNDVYYLYSNSTFKDTITKFKLGEEFNEETPDGRTVQSIITLEEGNKLVHLQKGDKTAKIVRWFDEDQVKMLIKHGKLKHVRKRFHLPVPNYIQTMLGDDAQTIDKVLTVDDIVCTRIYKPLEE